MFNVRFRVLFTLLPSVLGAMRSMDLRTRLRDDLAATAELPYGGEPVNQLTHALQAGTLAVDAVARSELVAAALLHDIGRSPTVAPTMPGLTHERAGAAYCRQHVSHQVGWLVGSHVMAKRALVATDPEYLDLLSPAAVRSLADEGGPASAAELDRFLGHPLAADAMAMRRWCDEAKNPGMATMSLDELLDITLLVSR